MRPELDAWAPAVLSGEQMFCMCMDKLRQERIRETYRGHVSQMYQRLQTQCTSPQYEAVYHRSDTSGRATYINDICRALACCEASQRESPQPAQELDGATYAFSTLVLEM